MLNKITKKKLMCNTLERFISESEWAFNSAKENLANYEERKNNPEYNWEQYDDDELEERKYTVECYETIIAALEKLV